MWKHVHCGRFIWNWGLSFQKRRYEETGKKLSGYELVKRLTPLKKQEGYQWLTEVSTTSLQTTLLDLDKAYKNFFKSGFGFPKFKSRKKARPSFPVRQNRFYFTESHVNIEKLGKVSYKTDHEIPLGKEAKWSNPRIHYTPNGKWILTVSVERENQTPELTDEPMGIDLGIKTTAVVSFNGGKISYPNVNKSPKMRKLNKKLKRLQRNVSRKYHTNGNYEKTSNILKLESKIKKLQYRVANIRADYNHKMTHDLVSMEPKRIVMEDLNVSGMMKNKHLSKAIQQQNFHEIMRQLEYKCEWRGIEFVRADRFYPSSKTCSHCGSVKKDLKLSDRTYICEECGLVIDRDYNAAINLMKYVA